KRGAKKQSKSRDCFTEFTLSTFDSLSAGMANVFAMTIRECHCEGQSPEAISYIKNGLLRLRSQQEEKR
ncbi:MAG: hypothetical protein ACRENW_05610, partial [Thermodesulfobacteriota bacterium]